jgi:hypothetical protein
MKKILLTLPIIFSILAMSPAMAALKPYCQEKITTSAFDFSIDSITKLNCIKIGYLEYGRATASVTKIDLNPTYNNRISYNGKLYFYASGLDKHLEPFTVTVISTDKKGNNYVDLTCKEFCETKIDCTADKAMMIVTNKAKGEKIYLTDFEYIADKVADTVTVSANDWHGKVLDATVEDWVDRVPQKPTIFTEWNNFAKFPTWCYPSVCTDSTE